MLRKLILSNYYFKVLLSFFGVLVLAITLRIFAFELFSIPSASMEGALFPGDIVYVSKLSYGPKLPRSRFEIPWINLLFFIFSDKSLNRNTDEWNYVRLAGFTTIKRDDIFVFDIPTEKREFIVKRCVGLPGNTLQIRNTELFIDGKPYTLPETVKNFYELSIKDWTAFNIAAETMDIKLQERKFTLDEEGKLLLVLSKAEKNKLSLLSCISSIELAGQPNPLAFPLFTNSHFGWTYDNFGPVKVPEKGFTINLNDDNFILYSYILKNFEHVDVRFSNGKWMLNGNEAHSYTFKKDYYFMLGDNRSDSLDSRFYGFVPEENILGKTSFVLFSHNSQGINWKRFFYFL